MSVILILKANITGKNVLCVSVNFHNVQLSFKLMVSVYWILISPACFRIIFGIVNAKDSFESTQPLPWCKVYTYIGKYQYVRLFLLKIYAAWVNNVWSNAPSCYNVYNAPTRNLSFILWIIWAPFWRVSIFDTTHFLIYMRAQSFGMNMMVVHSNLCLAI